MIVKEYPIASVRPYANNPRRNESAVLGVARSIERFGFKQPIVIDKTNTIVCGHTRYLAAKKLGLKSVPCVCADELSDDDVKAYRLLDNKLGELAEWDSELLSQELAEFVFDFAPFGVDFEIEEPEEEDEKDVKTRVPNAYQLVVNCVDEAEQEALYDRLKSEGYDIKVCNI